MTNTYRVRTLAWILITATVLACAPPARAQDVSPNLGAAETTAPGPSLQTFPQTWSRPSLLKPFTAVFGDIGRLPARENLEWLAIGVGAALGAHTVDDHVTRHWVEPNSQAFKPGATIGGTPLQLGAAFATYAIGRLAGSPRATSAGSDLIQAQLLAQIVTMGVKQGVRRARPEGSGFSFPSGHTAVSFASATVLQRHYGWKVGVPAYAVASYVAASRVEMKKHYLSDVAFGAALGIMAGRTVTVGRRHEWMLTPIATEGGGGVGFTLIGKDR